MNDATIIKDCAPVAVAVPDALRALVEAIEFSPLGIRQIKALEQARAALAATPAAAPVVPKWIDDPHDIEQGQMLNPEWVKVQEVASAPAAAAPVELPEPDALVTRKIGDICSFYSMTARKGDKLYSEQQVRALLTQAAAPAAPVDREDFAWLVVQEACETEPADEDDPECIRILRRDLKTAVLAALLRGDIEPAAPAAPDLKRENANLYEALAWWRRDAKIRGAAARLLMENLSDEDRLGDGRINTTRVRELLEPITRDTDEQPRDLGDSPATAAPAAPSSDGLRAQHDRDSAEMRRLCQARDEARCERDPYCTGALHEEDAEAAAQAKEGGEA